jgi:hypothetical protein
VDPFVILGSLLMLGSGLTFVGLGMWCMLDSWRMLGSATGTIIDTELGYEGETLAIVTFTTAQGTNVRFVADNPLGVGSTRVGRLVRVRYDDADPRHARIATFGFSYAGPIFLVAFGATPLALFALAICTL